MTDRKEHLWIFFHFLDEVKKELSKEEEKQVMIEKAINLRLMCDYVVSCSHGDIVLIICMLHDYIKILDEVKLNDIVYQAYYRNKFIKMADRLSAQIGYDYDEAVKKCKDNCMKERQQSDIGDDGLSHYIKRSAKSEKKTDMEQKQPMKEK